MPVDKIPKADPPEAEEHEPRNQRLALRLTPVEHDQLKARAVALGVRLAELTRETLLREAKGVATGELGRVAACPAGERRTRHLHLSLTVAERHHLLDQAERAGVRFGDLARFVLADLMGYERSLSDSFDGSSSESDVVAFRLPKPILKRVERHAKQNGLTVEEFLLKQAIRRPERTLRKQLQPALVSEINRLAIAMDRVGNNVNQIAKANHLGREMPGLDAEAARELVVERAKVREAMDKVLSAYVG